MPKIKTATIIIVSILAISSLLFFLPVKELLYRLPYINQFYNNTTVSVTTKNSKAEVFIGSKSYGETPVVISDLPADEYTFRLKRISDVSDAYEDRFIQIDLERNTEAVIELEIGPESISSGYVLYYTKSPVKNDKGYLSINTQPENATVYIDGEYADKSPLNAYIANPKSYDLRITNQGYENVEFPVIVRKGYNLNVKAFLFPIPINISDTNEQ
jgi:hypothetical protein